jgi:hypothetical protein
MSPAAAKPQQLANAPAKTNFSAVIAVECKCLIMERSLSG